MVAGGELQHYQVKVGYLGFMNQYFICVQLTSSASVSALGVKYARTLQLCVSNMRVRCNFERECSEEGQYCCIFY